MNILFLTTHHFGYEAWQWLTHYENTWEKHNLAYVYGKCPEAEYDSYDLGISFLYNHRVPAAQVNSHTWVNFHPAPLPEYGGRNVAYHAILDEAKEFGATIHYMNEYFDEGDIVEVKRFPISDSITAGELAEQARQTCLELFQKYIPRFLSGDKPMGFPQDYTRQRYYPLQKIDNNVYLPEHVQREIRAVTALPKFVAKTMIGDREYVIVPSELYHSHVKSSAFLEADSFAII